MPSSASVTASFRSLSSRSRNGRSSLPTLPSSSSNRINHNGGKVKVNVTEDRSLVLSRLQSFERVQMSSLSLDHRDMEAKINDIFGSGIAGVLYKWVNYGSGWRSRWFVLQDGVLSYYKIHGSGKIVLDQEHDCSFKVIGEESKRHIARDRSCPKSSAPKPIGEIHLKVCTIRESESDDKRFSVYTGTKKRLHLRAESREDRAAWLEALRAVKDMFPRYSNSNVELMTSNVVVSIEKLRHRLMEEGINETAIQDSENIMRTELFELQKHIVALKQKQVLLMDTLRLLETDKVDLENTVVNESQMQQKEEGDSFRSKPDNQSGGSASDSSDDNDRHDVAEEDSDDNDATFFDTQEFLSSSSVRSKAYEFQMSPFDSNDEESPTFGDAIDSCIKSARSNYPDVKRRESLPVPVETEKGISLWSMIKDNVGKDLTKVCLPVFFNEPLSSLQKCFEEFEYSYLLDQAYQWGKMDNNLMRILNVAAFAVSTYAGTEGRSCKPFNPLLGETYEADCPDKGLWFISEKVSHHPMVMACHCDGQGWKFWGDSNLKSKFWGRSIQLDPIGILTLEFEDGETFQWSKVTTCIYNLILGKIYCDHYGTMQIEGNQGYSCKIKFKEQSLIDRNPYQVNGIVQDKNGKTVASLFGKWNESLHYVMGDYSGKGKGSRLSPEPQLIWKRSKRPKYQTKYNLTSFAITLNELAPGLQKMLPPTDSRLRPDQRCLENGEYDKANLEKLRLEQRQRQARMMQESGWRPRWFAKENGSKTYHYIGGYWEARQQMNWESCPDIFGQLLVDQNSS